MDFKLDMSMMFAMHDALRRELVQVGRVAGQRDDNPAKLLQAALGWELFKKSCWFTTSPKMTPYGRSCAPAWPDSPSGRHWWTRWRRSMPSSSRS